MGYGRCLRRKGSAAVLVAGLLSAAHAGSAERQPSDLHRTLYNGEPLRYSVLRNGKNVGSYTVTFREVKDRLEVDTVFQMRLSFLLFSYDYRYISTGFWRDGALIALEAQVDANGDKTLVRALRQQERWVIDGPRGRQVIETTPALFATTHWNPDVIGVRRILNTITGDVAEIVMENRGRIMVRVGTKQIEATEWAYTGQLENRVWYDDQGRWLGMAFEGKDGSDFEVIAQSIGQPGA